MENLRRLIAQRIPDVEVTEYDGRQRVVVGDHELPEHQRVGIEGLVFSADGGLEHSQRALASLNGMEAEGFSVDTAETAADALVRAREFSPEIVLLEHFGGERGAGAAKAGHHLVSDEQNAVRIA